MYISEITTCKRGVKSTQANMLSLVKCVFNLMNVYILFSFKYKYNEGTHNLRKCNNQIDFLRDASIRHQFQVFFEVSHADSDPKDCNTYSKKASHCLRL